MRKILTKSQTLRAFLLNLFISENCLSLDLTTSPRGTFGAFFAFCSQGCSRSINTLSDKTQRTIHG